MLKKRFFKTVDECEVTFELAAEKAEHAELVCEVNGWKPIKMKKARKGPFRTRLRFPKEQSYEFRYLIDELRANPASGIMPNPPPEKAGTRMRSRDDGTPSASAITGWEVNGPW